MTIRIKRSAVPGKVPTTGDLVLGQLAMNTNDGKLFMKKDVSGVESVVEVGGSSSSSSSLTATPKGTVVSLTTNDVSYLVGGAGGWSAGSTQLYFNNFSNSAVGVYLQGYAAGGVPIDYTSTFPMIGSTYLGITSINALATIVINQTWVCNAFITSSSISIFPAGQTYNSTPQPSDYTLLNNFATAVFGAGVLDAGTQSGTTSFTIRAYNHTVDFQLLPTERYVAFDSNQAITTFAGNNTSSFTLYPAGVPSGSNIYSRYAPIIAPDQYGVGNEWDLFAGTPTPEAYAVVLSINGSTATLSKPTVIANKYVYIDTTGARQVITGLGTTSATMTNAVAGTRLYKSSVSLLGDFGSWNMVTDSPANPTISSLNTVVGSNGMVAGGASNTVTAAGQYGFVGGGYNNTVSGSYGAIVGGYNNYASHTGAFIGVGYNCTASGTYSVVGGGYTNSLASNSNYSVICGGYTNTSASSTTYSFIGGGLSNRVNTNYSVIAGGSSNTTSGQYAFIGGGISNIASGTSSSIAGGAYGSTRGITGYHAQPFCTPSETTNKGQFQGGMLILSRNTGSATATRATSDTSTTGSAANQLVLANNSAVYFRATVVANVTGAGNTKCWVVEGLIKRGATASTTALVGTPTVTSPFADAGASTWVIAVSADTTNGALAFIVTGQAATTIRWTVKIDSTEVTA